MWKKPEYIELDKNLVLEKINAKAWTAGEAMSYGALCDQGVGTVGVIYLPEGIFDEAYVAAWDAVTNVYTFIVSGVKRFFNKDTGVFT